MASRRRVMRVVVVGVAVVGLLFGPFAGAAGSQEGGRCNAGWMDRPCEIAKGVGDKVGSGVTNVVAAPVQAAAGSMMDQLTRWVADAAVSLIAKIVNLMDSSTDPRLGSSWFTDRYELMMGLGLLVLVPLLLIAAIRAIFHQDLSQLLRSFFIYLPLAVLSTFVAIHLTQMLLSITDELSAAVSSSVGGDATRFLDGGAGSVSTTLADPALGGFLVFFGALLVVVAGLLLWIELLIRSAGIYVCVFFLPLVLAGLVWPATARWTKRLIETLVALILSKFVIVSIISLAVAALGDPGKGGVSTVVGGASLLLLASFSPFALFKLVPLAEAASISHLEGLERRPTQAMQSGTGGFSLQGFVRDKVAQGRSAPSGASAAPVAAGAGAVTGGAAATVLATRAARGADPQRRTEGMVESLPGQRRGEAARDKPEAAKTPTTQPSGGRLAMPETKRARDST